MDRRKTPISEASSYREIGEFWDEHDLSDYWDQTHDVEIDVRINLSAETAGSSFRDKGVVKSRHDRSR
jgi:hypothetical protein